MTFPRLPKVILLVIIGHCFLLYHTYGQEPIAITDSLTVVQLSPSVWQHMTLQYYPAFGTFTSNGIIYRSGFEAVLMDTPASKRQSKALLEWWREQFPEVTLKAVIVNHFHDDALGGLQVFHEAGITSYAHRQTGRLLRRNNPSAEKPQRSFRKTRQLKVGDAVVVNFYPGPAHTRDNIVTWIPAEKVLFGGCMVKSLGANKGNVADADLARWSDTIDRLLIRFPRVETVIPGHGEVGDKSLLQYTSELFRN